MGRLLILVLLGLVAAWWIFSRIGKLRDAGHRAKPGQPKNGAQDMVACAHCGVHLPLNETVMASGLHYCGDSHRLKGPKGPRA